MYTLATWQIDRKRSSDLFRARKKELGYTVPQLAEGTGISEDTVNNILNCKTDPTMERVIKLCLFLKMDLYQDYLLPLFEGLDADEAFAAQLSAMLGAGCSVRAQPAAPSCGNRAGCEKQIQGVMQTVMDSHEHTLDRFKSVHDRYHQQQVQQLQEGRDLVIAAKDAQIATLREDLARQAHHITRLRNRNHILGIAVAAETVFIAVTWLMDLLIHDSGWIRRTIASFLSTGYDTISRG